MGKFTIPERVIYVCTGSKCSKRGGKELYKNVKAFSKYYGDKNDLEVIQVDCFDRCKYAPVCNIQPDNIWLKEYHEKEVLKVLQIIMQDQPKV
ncbi:(2Fe-2S) ferredoxin domain-containing protein [Mucilaginibacter sp. L196]|uniref:(2Fe-2S) ferredoxin domain-containing protein n=1 Tax=Mucilaginibacter sp. L196 TaxID=1641870 RepID=UPI00131D6143|nr:(2Fe-2S) ferredoxin domain-containing protein [Mucilaginibacter sp. L196]